MFKFLKRFRRETPPVLITPKPQHIAVIMDGNGRWANARGLSRVAGHKRGVDSVKTLIKSCLEYEIPHLSLFAFSSENWRRPQSEVNALMELLSGALIQQTSKLNEYGVRLSLMGDLSGLDSQIQSLAQQAMQATAHNERLNLCVAINYGGRWDIVQAARALAERVAAGSLLPQDIDEALFAEQLCTHGVPDPDLYIRTSGEYRISNFMLWQGAYSEFYFTDTLWPDFGEAAFVEALTRYTHRDRRYGTAVDKIDMELSAPKQQESDRN